MRRWLRLALFLLLLPAPTRAMGPADGPGCVGVTVPECIGWLRATMRLNEGALARTIANRQTVDVNGRRLGGLVTVYAQLPDRTDAFVILLHVRPDDRIERVETNLLHELAEARTEAIYDRSAFYDIAWRLLGRRCASLNKLELYRFFENTVKPRIKQERQDVANGLLGLHRVVSRVTGIPFCSGSFSYLNQVEWRGSAAPEAGRNPSNFTEIDLR